MKKIPQGAEASNIMVGEVEFLNHPITAFVRLSKSVLLADLTEVPVPTRFLYILLGPVGNAGKYHEIGRSIATLMSDEVLECFLFGLFFVWIVFSLFYFQTGMGLNSWTLFIQKLYLMQCQNNRDRYRGSISNFFLL